MIASKACPIYLSFVVHPNVPKVLYQLPQKLIRGLFLVAPNLHHFVSHQELQKYIDQINYLQRSSHIF
jgi:uncharacterized lipoprotein YddW (UPF0748 family)